MTAHSLAGTPASLVATENAVEVRGLRVEIGGGVAIVDDVSLDIRPGEILGLVGQSGSGKTTVAMSLLGYSRAGARIVGGTVRVAGHDVRSLDRDAVRELRGTVVSYVPQDPRASLNPAIRIRDQIGEVLEYGQGRRSKDERVSAVRRALEEVGLPSDDEFLARFPHQLSGGQLQRVGIAMAVVGQPPVIVLDEPTTGLDVTTQRRILRLVRRLCSDHGIAGLYVTHDLAAIAEVADRILVMNEGVTVEEGDLAAIFERPQQEYTKRLIAASPDVTMPGPAPEPVVAAPSESLVARNIDGGYRKVRVLHDVSLEVGPGECVALVGESGSGKSTLSRILIGLHPDYTGELVWHGRALARRAGRRRKSDVRELQYIFQSPFSALNPRMTARQSIEFAHRLAVPSASRRERKAAVAEAITKVRLTPALADQLPGRLSGGERQRVAIARALVTKPRLVICDEVTSALDVLVQASIIDLLRELRHTEKLSMIFVTHDLGVVRSFADRVVVLDGGTIVEQGPTEQVLGAPQHPYTRSLMDNTLSIAGALDSRS